MSVSPRGSGWQVYVKRGDRRYRVAAETEAQGKAMEAEILRAIEAGREPDLGTIKRLSPLTGGKTLRDVIDRIHQLRWGRSKAGDTALINLNVCAAILGEDTPIETIDAERVDELVLGLQDRGNSDATINRKMSALRVLLDEAQKRGWCGAPPKLPHNKEGKGRVRYLSEAEESSLDAMSRKLGREDLADLWTFLIDTGCRISEALNLEWRFVEASRVTFEKTKNDEPRTIPLTRRCQEILRQRRNHDRPWPFAYSECRHWWDRVRALLGMADDPHWVIHILRHTCASRLAIKDVHPQKLQKWMGHKSYQMTLRYAHLSPGALDGVVSVLEPAAPVAELVDAVGLGPTAEGHGGSSPSRRTKLSIGVVQ